METATSETMQSSAFRMKFIVFPFLNVKGPTGFPMRPVGGAVQVPDGWIGGAVSLPQAGGCSGRPHLVSPLEACLLLSGLCSRKQPPLVPSSGRSLTGADSGDRTRARGVETRSSTD